MTNYNANTHSGAYAQAFSRSAPPVRKKNGFFRNLFGNGPDKPIKDDLDSTASEIGYFVGYEDGYQQAVEDSYPELRDDA